jgi:carnitine 3-dehydrogenase
MRLDRYSHTSASYVLGQTFEILDLSQSTLISALVVPPRDLGSSSIKKMVVKVDAHNDRATVKSVAVAGAGVIGSSWAALFAAHGLHTIVYDPVAEAEPRLRQVVKDAVITMQKLDRFKSIASCTDVQSMISFTTDLTAAVQDADVIQENGPENIQVKLKTLSMIEGVMKPDALILSSTSGLPPSKMQEAMKRYAGNFLIGHPFNPPHLLPLVEVVGGQQTFQTSIQRAMAFYRMLGKQPIQIRKELPGHVANRLQSALFREIFYLLQEDVVDVGDIDVAMEYGPGLRWGVMGPSLLMHLGGGPGGARGYADKYMKHLMSWYAPQDPCVDNSLTESWIDGVEAAAEGKSQSQLQYNRDTLLIALLNAKDREILCPPLDGTIGL